MQYILPFEIWQEIILKCDFLNAIHLRQLNKWFYKLEIHNFYDINYKYRCKLTDDILKVYPFIQKLDVSNNEKITDVNYLTNLKVLNVGGYHCGISDNGLNKLTNLTKLYTSNNSRITDINHLINLKSLYAGDHCCGISDNGISKLTNLTKLYKSYNPKITRKIENQNA